MEAPVRKAEDGAAEVPARPPAFVPAPVEEAPKRARSHAPSAVPRMIPDVDPRGGQVVAPPTDAEMVGWLFGKKVRVPRSRREWTIEPGETAEFAVLDMGPVPEGGTLSRIRFTVVDSEQRGLRVEGLLRYTYAENGDGGGWQPIDFTPVHAERIGNW
jgi:hypothetical protein